MTPPGLPERLASLDRTLAEAGSLLVAYSGGVDSAFLALRAHEMLGPRALAVTADSPSLPRAQLRLAEEVAARFGFAHRVIALHLGEVIAEGPPESIRANARVREVYLGDA